MHWIQLLAIVGCASGLGVTLWMGAAEPMSWVSGLLLWWLWFACLTVIRRLSNRWDRITRSLATLGGLSACGWGWWLKTRETLSVSWFEASDVGTNVGPWYLYAIIIGTSLCSWLWIQYANRSDSVNKGMWTFAAWQSIVSLLVLLLQTRGIDVLDGWSSIAWMIVSIFFVGDLGWVLWHWRTWNTASHDGSLLTYIFCRRMNPISSVFDALEQLFGIDVQGTWIIQYVRSMLEPLCYGLLLVGWLTTSLVMVHPTEQGVRTSFGVVEIDVLEGGLHLKWPWPLGTVQTISTQRIHQLSIGHQEDLEELDDEGGPESILWANQHASEEFLLLLGDGHDVISADGALEYRIVDPHAYLFNGQNPELVLASVVYQVLMAETSSRTLEEALSENLSVLAATVTEKIRIALQPYQLGIEPIVFTFTALHPPVSVAQDYQEVVSAQIDQLTKQYRAEQYQLSTLPKERAEKLRQIEKAKQAALTQKAAAVGEAMSFEALRQTVRGNQALYRFRIRQDNLEKSIAGRPLIVLDHRLEQQGAALWIQP